MTANEIVKALRECADPEHWDCQSCVYDGSVICKGRAAWMRDAADLIEQQQAEIERIKNNAIEWIPFETRDVTDDEAETHPEWDYVFVSPIPDDEQDILVTDGNNVWKDVFFNDDICYLDSDAEIVDGFMWAELPKPPKVFQ